MTGPTPMTDATPVIVVHGDATPEEIAALVAVLSAAAAPGPEGGEQNRTSPWSAHSAAMRRPVPHGPGAWRTSLRS